MWVRNEVDPWALVLYGFAFYATGRFALACLITKVRAYIKHRGESAASIRRVP